MKKIKLNTWYVNENNLSTIVNCFNITIVPMNYHIELNLIYGEQIIKKYKFYSFEEAIVFTEDVISNLNSIDEIDNKYYELNPKPKLKSKTK
ncbi:MAG: hypothetical protein IJS56_02285 [Bacilli bacterium]|nr:hypothetical protein [Bacilli bacterium]